MPPLKTWENRGVSRFCRVSLSPSPEPIAGSISHWACIFESWLAQSFQQHHCFLLLPTTPQKPCL